MSGPVIWKDLTCTTEKQYFSCLFRRSQLPKHSWRKVCKPTMSRWVNQKWLQTHQNSLTVKVTFMLQWVLKYSCHVDHYELRQQFRCRGQTKIYFTWKAVGSLWLCPLVYLEAVLNFKNQWTILLGKKRKKKEKKKRANIRSNKCRVPLKLNSALKKTKFWSLLKLYLYPTNIFRFDINFIKMIIKENWINYKVRDGVKAALCNILLKSQGLKVMCWRLHGDILSTHRPSVYFSTLLTRAWCQNPAWLQAPRLWPLPYLLKCFGTSPSLPCTVAD